MDTSRIDQKIKDNVYTAPEGLFDTDRAAYKRAVRDKNSLFKADLKEASKDLLTVAQFEKAYAVAWDWGHSSGYNDVLLVFDDLVAVVTAKGEEGA